MVCQTFLLDPILYAVALHTWIFMPACLTADMFLIVPYCATENLTKQQLHEHLLVFFMSHCSFDGFNVFPGANCADILGSYYVTFRPFCTRY